MLLPGALLGPAAAAGAGQEAAGPGHTQLLQKLRLPGSSLAKHLGHSDKQHGSRSQHEVAAKQAGVQRHHHQQRRISPRSSGGTLQGTTAVLLCCPEV